MESFASIVRNSFHQQASLNPTTVCFPDCEDVRVLQAAHILLEKNIAIPLLVGHRKSIESIALSNEIEINGIKIVVPQEDDGIQRYAEMFFDLRKTKGISIEEATKKVLQPLYYGGLLLKDGIVDSCVAGATTSTGDVLRAAIQTVGLKKNTSVVSSYFIMILSNKVVFFADCGVVPNPDSKELSNIASSTVQNFRKLFRSEIPNVAFLSFSTKGSATTDSVLKVREAFELFKNENPSIIADGELQFDAAFVPEIALKKAEDSPVKGNANIYIFPNLDAGNIAYKIAQRIGNATAIGPIIQGLEKPYCDLSRGCSVNDIVDVASISSLLSS